MSNMMRILVKKDERRIQKKLTIKIWEEGKKKKKEEKEDEWTQYKCLAMFDFFFAAQNHQRRNQFITSITMQFVQHFRTSLTFNYDSLFSQILLIIEMFAVQKKKKKLSSILVCFLVRISMIFFDPSFSFCSSDQHSPLLLQSLHNNNFSSSLMSFISLFFPPLW